MKVDIIGSFLPPTELAEAKRLYAAGAMDWIGLVLIAIVIPAVVAWLVSELMRKKGLIRGDDYKLDL